MRCDDKYINELTIDEIFQSTHLREVRRHKLSLWWVVKDFNPRTYVRCDIMNDTTENTLEDFNPRTYVRCDVHVQKL